MSKLAEMTDGIIEALKQIPKDGVSGAFPCPVCKTGTINWIRVPFNRHIRMVCSTPDCIMMMQ